MMTASHSRVVPAGDRTTQCESLSEVWVTDTRCREKRGRFSNWRQKRNNSSALLLTVQVLTTFLDRPLGTAAREVLRRIVAGIIFWVKFKWWSGRGVLGKHPPTRSAMKLVGPKTFSLERGRIDEVKMPPHQFGKGILGFLPGIPAEQFTIGCHCQHIAPGRGKSGQEYLGNLWRSFSHFLDLGRS